MESHVCNCNKLEVYSRIERFSSPSSYSSTSSCGRRNCLAISISCVTSSSVNRSSLSSTSSWMCNAVVGGSLTIIKHSAFVSLNGFTAARNATMFAFVWVLHAPSSRNRIVWKWMNKWIMWPVKATKGKPNLVSNCRQVPQSEFTFCVFYVLQCFHNLKIGQIRNTGLYTESMENELWITITVSFNKFQFSAENTHTSILSRYPRTKPRCYLLRQSDDVECLLDLYCFICQNSQMLESMAIARLRKYIFKNQSTLATCGCAH